LGLLEETSRLLKISWSTFQPRDDSSKNFWLVELRDTQGLLAEAIKTTQNHITRLQVLMGLSYGHPWALLGGRSNTDYYVGPRTTRLVGHGARWCGLQDNRGLELG
jgi:hypothetical protein